jgi:hypothetical protein
MAAVLKAVDLLACAACLFVLLAVIPDIEARGVVPAGATIGFAVGIAPLLALGARAWGLFSAIGRGETFTKENARRLRAMGYFAAADALVWLALIVVGVLATDGLVFSVVASLSVAFVFTFALTVVCVALSHLASSAADIKSENDLVV